MLVFKAQQVVASGSFVSRPWEMEDDKGKERSGVSNYVEVTCLGLDGKVAVIRLTGKDEAEVKTKVAKLTIGKPAEITVTDIKARTGGVMVLKG